MIKPENIDSKLINSRKKYRLLYFFGITSCFIIFVFSPLLSLLYLGLYFISEGFIGKMLFRRKAQFNCIKCGLCCSLKVIPTESDIKRIEKNLNKPRESFIENRGLKKVNGYCMFLKNKNGENTCSIYKFRPEACRRWPFKHFNFEWLQICPSLRALLRNKPKT